MAKPFGKWLLKIFVLGPRIISPQNVSYKMHLHNVTFVNVKNIVIRNFPSDQNKFHLFSAVVKMIILGLCVNFFKHQYRHWLSNWSSLWEAVPSTPHRHDEIFWSKRVHQEFQRGPQHFAAVGRKHHWLSGSKLPWAFCMAEYGWVFYTTLYLIVLFCPRTCILIVQIIKIVFWFCKLHRKSTKIIFTATESEIFEFRVPTEVLKRRCT